MLWAEVSHGANFTYAGASTDARCLFALALPRKAAARQQARGSASAAADGHVGLKYIHSDQYTLTPCAPDCLCTLSHPYTDSNARPRSPETMLAALRRWPAARTLEDVKDCLDFCSAAWLQLFCRLGGAPLLLEVAPGLETCCCCLTLNP